jgi:predicted nuclease with TOPRIM domain
MEETKVQETTEGGQEPQNQQQTAAAGAQPGQEPAAEQFDAEYVRKLRAEAADYRKRLRELEQTVKQHEEAKLSESERLQKRLAELEREQAAYQRERQERTLKYETMLAASKLGIVDPEAAYKLLDLTRIEFDEDGTPRNIEAALKELLKAKPYLAATATAGSPTNPARATTAEDDQFVSALFKGAGLTKQP